MMEIHAAVLDRLTGSEVSLAYRSGFNTAWSTRSPSK